MCVQVHDPLSFSFLWSFLFFDCVGVLWPQFSKVLQFVRWASSVPFSPSIPTEAGCLFAVATCVHVFISGESLLCFLVGVNKSYVIATSDLWLFIHASNMLPSTPHPTPLHISMMETISAMWWQAGHAIYQLSSPSCSARVIQKCLYP